jgi:phage terminase large subunit
MADEREIVFNTFPVFEPLLVPARYKGAHGGRGSAKSHFFAELMIEYALMEPGVSGEGLFAGCLRQVQKSLKDSAKRLIENKLQHFRLGEADGFKVYHDSIKTPGDGRIIFQGMSEQTAESVKSLEGLKVAWWEEAQTAVGRSLDLLRPTLRKEDSEMWFSWNPRRPTDPIDVLLRGEDPPTGAIVVESNWRDNPMFPKSMEEERLNFLRQDPDQYPHIWEGQYATVIKGAYYAKFLTQAADEGRILPLKFDPLHRILAFWDLGGMGQKSDAVAIWIGQFVGHEIYALDYYEAQGQAARYHILWMQENWPEAKIFLPHDGEPNHPLYEGSWETALRKAGFDVEIVPNQGAGAAMMRVESGREHFHRVSFDKDKTAPGRDCLGWYHEKRDDTREVGLGPHHDWSSNCADAFGMMLQVYEPPVVARKARTRPRSRFGWMG